MPRTKIDRRAISPEEVRARIVRSAADRKGLYRDTDIADVLNRSRSCISNRLNGLTHWRISDLEQLSRALEFTDDEIIQFVRGRCG
jgi:hypothetical protein